MCGTARASKGMKLRQPLGLITDPNVPERGRGYTGSCVYTGRGRQGRGRVCFSCGARRVYGLLYE